MDKRNDLEVDIEDREFDGKPIVGVGGLEVKLEEKHPKKPLWLRIIIIFMQICFLLATLYGFLLGLTILSDSFRVLTAKTASNLFGFAQNPLAGLMVGNIVTVLFQSSSTTTSIIIGLVGSGVLSVGHAVPIIMGANIGTSITNTIVSIGQIGSGEQFRKAFAGATVHDCFNIYSCCIFLPIEWIVMAANNECGFFCWMCTEITEKMLGLKGAEFSSPLDAIIKPFSNLFVQVI